MDHLVLSDAMWERVAPCLPGKSGDPGRSAVDNRLFMEAVLWMVRARPPWTMTTIQTKTSHSTMTRAERGPAADMHPDARLPKLPSLRL